ncbi:MAG: hypothetical protein I3273_00625 [Candidatus Moeniiplasma glomeromycotorum]|nr:hypothetical protein [Candidatus Moeniiplasma glomeromycotorum]MCE8167372.1 hypothetical protein [Candidatus Moeniiplasma glomeromycotorum]MCE8168615.1 hypothetical protein [Candidatus Moeniiplasma glomeromycotorum]
MLFARYHSAGHLLSLAVNRLYPELDGYKGNHFPDQASVVFEGNLPTDFSLLKEKVNSYVNQLVKNSYLVQAEWKITAALSTLLGFIKNYPCGITHVKNTSEIGEIVIRKIKKEKGSLRNSYNVL